MALFISIILLHFPMSKALSALTDNLPLFGKLLHCLLYRCYESACFCNYLFLIEPIILG